MKPRQVVEWVATRIERRADAWCSIDYDEVKRERRAACPAGCDLCYAGIKCDRCMLPLCVATRDGRGLKGIDNGAGGPWCRGCEFEEQMLIRHRAGAGNIYS